MNRLFKLYALAADGNENAYAFLIVWHGFCHRIDDLVDGDVKFEPEVLVDLLMQANALYSMPFYIANSARLSGCIASIANTYSDSVKWEKSDKLWQREVADTIRQCGNDMVVTVAGIMGGFPHMRRISIELRELAWEMQHEGIQDGDIRIQHPVQ